MSARRAIEQFARTWLKATARSSSALADAECILLRSKGPRPDAPYLAVSVTSVDVSDYSDETIAGMSGATPTRYETGTRRATLSVHGFGPGTDAWIERARLKLANEEATRELLADTATGTGIDLFPLGATQVIDVPLDTRWEERYLAEFEATYRSDTSEVPEEEIEVTEIQVALTLHKYDGDPDALSETVTLSI